MAICRGYQCGQTTLSIYRRRALMEAGERYRDVSRNIVVHRLNVVYLFHKSNWRSRVYFSGPRAVRR